MKKKEIIFPNKHRSKKVRKVVNRTCLDVRSVRQSNGCGDGMLSLRGSRVSVLTGQQHEDRGSGDVAGRPLPAADDAGPEGREDRHEGDYEQGDHRASHIWIKSLLSALQGFSGVYL